MAPPITDLFSHKIHSSGDDWPDKLVELAFLFAEFDGHTYDRDEIAKRLSEISPRSAYAPRDPSKFRDEISAYPAYLGLYRLEVSETGWRIKLSETAKAFLVREEPDVASFVLLQMILFQYPNGMGAAYRSGTNNLRIQANARDRSLNLISQGVHLSPLRLICIGLMADSQLRDLPLFNAFITFPEIFALANWPEINKTVLHSLGGVRAILTDFRSGKIKAPERFERRFHILRHTDLFELKKGGISFRYPVNKLDEKILNEKISTISEIDCQFEGFDGATSSNDLEGVIKRGDWGRYFDGISTLSGSIVSRLASDIISILVDSEITAEERKEKVVPKIPTTYSLKVREDVLPPPKPVSRKAELADPEVTKIKRQRRNLAHKLLIDKMYDYLIELGATPMENPHIDLFAKIPANGSFIFEMKSGGQNLLDQIRKGVSQLYEYRFRYNEMLGEDLYLCLVIKDEPKEIPWLYEYLCIDREMCVCWFDEKNDIEYPELCKDRISGLLNIAA
jgi:hypothetical protein